MVASIKIWHGSPKSGAGPAALRNSLIYELEELADWRMTVI